LEVSDRIDTALMGRHGINPKRWFYGFIDHLAERPDQTARVLCGPAAERWLAAEMFGHIAATLPAHLTCYGEDGTTDLTIYDVVKDGEVQTGDWEKGRIASIEIKLVYRHYSDTRVRSYATKLCDQVRANSDHGSTMNVGYIFGVFSGWPSKSPRVRGTFPEFRREVSQHVRDACESAGVPCAKPSLETVIDSRTIKIGGVEVPFGLIGQYVLPRALEDE